MPDAVALKQLSDHESFRWRKSRATKAFLVACVNLSLLKNITFYTTVFCFVLIIDENNIGQHLKILLLYKNRMV